MNRTIPLSVLCALIVAGGGCRAGDNKIELTKQLIAAMTSENKVARWPRLGPLTAWNLQMDTFTDEVPSSAIADLYATACKKLVDLYGEKVHTYAWKDPETYPRIATVVQFQDGYNKPTYLVVCASENNDNDSFSFQYCNGVFATDKKQIRPAWTLPKGMLRLDH